MKRTLLYKDVLLFVILLILPMCMYAQIEESDEFTYSVSKPYPVVDAPKKYYFHQDDGIMTVKIRGKLVTIQKFDAKTLNFKGQKIRKDMPAGFSLEGVFEFNKRFYMFYSVWDKPNAKEQLFSWEIDFEDGALKGKGKRLIRVDGKITGSAFSSVGFWSVGVVNKFGFQFSFDKTKMLIQYRKKPKIRDDSKNYDVIGMYVFDGDVEAVSGEEIKMPYTEKKMDNLDYSIDGDGITYILARVRKTKTSSSTASHYIELLRIEAGSRIIEKTAVKVGEKKIQSIWLYESPGDVMVCAGFYGKGWATGVDGMFIFKIDKDGGLYDMADYEIPAEIIKQYESTRTQKKTARKEARGKAVFENLKLRTIVVQSDGSMLLLGEQYYVKKHTYTDSNGNVKTYYTYHYEDMLVTKIGSDGKVAWMRKVPKRQMGKNGRGGMGFKYLSGAEHHYLIFLDNVRNMDLALNKPPAQHTDGAGGYLTTYKIHDETGEVTKLSIFDTKDVRGIKIYQFNTGRIFDISSNQMVIEVYKKKKQDVMIKITMK